MGNISNLDSWEEGYNGTTSSSGTTSNAKWIAASVAIAFILISILLCTQAIRLVCRSCKLNRIYKTQDILIISLFLNSILKLVIVDGLVIQYGFNGTGA